MHREIEEVTWRSPQLVDQLLEVWERSVRATHRFLSADGIAEIKLYVPQALREVPHLVAAWRENGTPAGFMGIDGQKLEMLFLVPEEAWRALVSGRSRSTSKTPRPGASMSTWAFASMSGWIMTNRAILIRFCICDLDDG